MSTRWRWAWPAITYAVMLLLLALVLRHGSATSADGVTTDTGGRPAAIALLLTALLPLFVTSLSVRIPRWVMWVAAAVSFAITFVLWWLVVTGRDALAWAAYGGLQVLRGRAPFTDIDVLVRWFDCNLCETWHPYYGPSIPFIDTVTLGRFTYSWVPLIGFTLAIGGLLGYLWIARLSSGRGRLVLLVAAVSPAWLLLLDRANIDLLFLIVLALGAYLTRRSASLSPWIAFAALIWISGTMKYFPFALGVALLPALRLRRGWTVLVGFGLASAAFMAVFWQDFVQSSKFNSEKIVVLFDFPAYGRLMVLDRMAGLYSESPMLLVGNVLFFALVLAAGAWGFVWARGLKTESVALPTLALGGSAAFLAAVAVSGFGFMYKGAFLLAVVPLMSRPVRSRSRFGLYTSLVTLVCIALALTIAYSSLLATLAGTIAASLALGAAIAVTWRQVQQAGQARARASHSSIAAS